MHIFLKLFPRFLFAVICASYTHSALAQEASNIFDDQRVLYSSELSERQYPLSLGSLEKIDGIWASEREVLVKARVFKTTFEISHPYDLVSAWQEVQDYFARLEASLVYECLGLKCGSSNAWANERFEIKQLYGLDLSQKYQVWQWRAGENTRLAVVYLVQRGNRRVYFQLDQLWPSDDTISFAPSASVISKRFYKDGRIEVSGLYFENGNIVADESHISALASALNEQPFRLLSVVGHDYFPGTAEEQALRSTVYATAIVNLLKKNGVRPKRLLAVGKGGVEPQKPNQLGKVEVMLRPR